MNTWELSQEFGIILLSPVLINNRRGPYLPLHAIKRELNINMTNKLCAILERFILDYAARLIKRITK